MKKNLAFLMILALVLGCTALGYRAEEKSAGEVYEGSGDGFRGKIHVQVRLNEGEITEIIVLDSMEDRFVGEAAIEELIDTVIEQNSTDVDAVTGASITSKGFLDAVNNAIMGL